MVRDTLEARPTEASPLVSGRRRLPGLTFAGGMLAPQPDGMNFAALPSRIL